MVNLTVSKLSVSVLQETSMNEWKESCRLEKIFPIHIYVKPLVPIINNFWKSLK